MDFDLFVNEMLQVTSENTTNHPQNYKNLLSEFNLNYFLTNNCWKHKSNLKKIYYFYKNIIEKKMKKSKMKKKKFNKITNQTV